MPEQPIFYPVVQEEYARKIARDWNVSASGSGYVTRFRVRASHLERYTVQEAGGRGHTEYWIPAEELEAFNDNIVGRIEVVTEFENGEWAVAYDLSTEQGEIDRVQRATLTTERFGVVPEIALFGSDAWWLAVGDGRIPTHVQTGKIVRLYMTGHGDWPEFELAHGDTKTAWNRLGNRSLYVEGGEARVEYVYEKLRSQPESPIEVKQILRILLRQPSV
ncbi:MAG: hypothetical protein U0441_14180 [Polyangiaceae bacterium]